MRVNQVSFTGVTPIIAKNKKTLEELDAYIQKNAPDASYELDDSTHLYKLLPSNPKGILANAAANKKRVAFLVTGEEYDKYSHMEPGWSSETAPSRHISEDVVVLDKWDNKKRQTIFSDMTKRVADDWSNWEKKRGY